MNSLDKMEDYDRIARVAEKQAQQIAAQLWALNILVPLARGYVKEHYKPNHLTATQCEQAASVVLDTQAAADAFIAEHDAQLVEECAGLACDYSDRYGNIYSSDYLSLLRSKAAELRATANKKSGNDMPAYWDVISGC